MRDKMAEDEVFDLAPGCSFNASRSLSSLGLPKEVVECYQESGITELFQWQADCLRQPGVLDGSINLVYSAPTSAGKTLVAEIAVLCRILRNRSKAIIIMPYISIAREKTLHLQGVFRQGGVRVEGYMGTCNPPGGIHTWEVAVCTMEKAHGLINRMIEEGSVGNIGSVVVDEIHSVSDPSRGYLLELMLTKLLFLSQLEDSKLKLQIIGMSATLPNLELLAEWLRGKVYTTDYRPVPLSECMLTGDNVSDCNKKVIREIPHNLHFKADAEHVMGLCLETIAEGNGVLLFCPTKIWCERLARNIADLIQQILSGKDGLSEKLLSAVNPELLSSFVNGYKMAHKPPDPTLSKTLQFGVCFHHAGLTMEERDWLEKGFKSGHIRVVIATSTLSSGVNLPAKRVIIRSPWGQPGRPGPFLTATVYRQMIGRAGRKAIDTSGESILVCKPSEVKRGLELMNSPMPPVQSTLMDTKGFNTSGSVVATTLKRALLEVVVSGLVKTVESAKTYLKCTLLAAQLAQEPKGGRRLDDILENAIESTLQYLCEMNFTTQSDGNFLATQLGSAALASSLAPETALTVYRDLRRATKSLCLQNELHLVYLVTPIYMQDGWGAEFSWSAFYDIWCRLRDDEKHVGDLVGISEAYLVERLTSRCAAKNTPENERKRSVHMRFYSALALYDLINEVSLGEAAKKYRCSRGFVQSLQQQASTYAGMIVTFCERLGWYNLHALLSGFAARLAFGIRRDLTELVQIDGLDGSRARAFHLAGLKTVASVANAKLLEIVQILRKAVPFDGGISGKHPWLANHNDMTEAEASKLIHDRAKNILRANLKALGLDTDYLDQSLAGEKASESAERDGGDLNLVLTLDDSDGDTDFGRKSESPIVIEDDEKPATVKKRTQKLTERIEAVTESVDVFFPSDTVSERDSGIAKSSEVALSKLPIGKENFLEESQRNAICRLSRDLSRVSVSPGLSDFVGFGSVPKSRPSGAGGSLTESMLIDLFGKDKSSPANRSSPGAAPPVLDRLAFQKKCDTSVNMDVAQTEENGDTSLSSAPGTPLLFSEDSNGEEVDEVLYENVLSPVLAVQPSCSNSKRFRVVSDDSPNPLLRKRTKCGSKNFNENATVHTEMGGPFRILDVCCSLEVFNEFSEKLLKGNTSTDNPVWAFALGLRENLEKRYEGASTVLGGGIVTKDKKFLVDGVAFCNKAETVYYVTFSESLNQGSAEEDNMFPVCTPHEDVSAEMKLNLLRKFFQSHRLKAAVWSATFLLKILSNSFTLSAEDSSQLYSFVNCDIFCLKTAQWMVKTEAEPLDLVETFQAYFPGNDLLGKKKVKEETSISRVVASKRAVACLKLLAKLDQRMSVANCGEAFWKVESKVLKSLLEMEVEGMGFDRQECHRMTETLKSKMRDLEKSAEKFAGRPFSIGSPSDVSKVLFKELKLPPDGDVQFRTGKKLAAGSHKSYSTSKDILEKLCKLHPLPKIILEWRKINNALTTALFPLLKYAEDGRIRGSFDMFTATGRVCMHEPNLQTIPKQFDVGESQICVRSLFVSRPGSVLVSADYSQLELRVLAHLSKDERLLEILNSKSGDVFRIIAASWKGISVKEVSDVQRQQAKQICYGVIYGMGANSLAEQLGVTVEAANEFLNSFKSQFTGVQRWILNVISYARKRQFVETLSGRRRYLSHISGPSSSASSRAQAERQAVNSTVQGSAADLFKAALVKVQKGLSVLNAAHGDCARLIMQLHDEVIAEVEEGCTEESIKIIRDSMENCWKEFGKINVSLNVKVKVGISWGRLKDYPE